MSDRPVSISDYIAGQVCHGCHSVGRFYDESRHVWYCRACVVLMVDEAERAEEARSYDGFMHQLRPRTDA